jgi:signal transduction histidine kinase
MKFFQNIKFRLTSCYLLMVALLIVFFGITGYFLLVEGLSRNLVTPFDMRIANIADMPDGRSCITDFTSISSQIGVNADYSAMQIPLSRLLEATTNNNTIEISALGSKPILVDRTLLLGDHTSTAGTWVYIFVSKTDPADQKLVLSSKSETGQASIFALFQRTMLIAAGITLLAAGLLGFFLVWRMLLPLQAMTRAARGITTRDLKSRLQVGRQDELGELAASLNQVFDRVETALETERQVTADLSHELRTPLAIAQAEATMALSRGRSDKEYQKALETVSREISHLSAVANRLLFLARSENGVGIVKEKFDLKEMLEDTSDAAAGLCAAKGIIFQSNLGEIKDVVEIDGDPVRLRELFLNLVDNAVRYTPPGGVIRIDLAVAGGRAAITVSDTGIGIAARHLPHIFERFYRVDGKKDSGGAGLGLTICKRIAELHGGAITVQSKPGKGTTFTVHLPVLIQSS